MYLGKRELKDPENYEMLRAIDLADKQGATHVAFSELEDIVNVSALARQYFKKSPGWLFQKLNGCMVLNRKKRFTASEYVQLAEAFRDIARRLEAHADEIDNAAPDGEAVG